MGRPLQKAHAIRHSSEGWNLVWRQRISETALDLSLRWDDDR